MAMLVKSKVVISAWGRRKGVACHIWIEYMNLGTE